MEPLADAGVFLLLRANLARSRKDQLLKVKQIIEKIKRNFQMKGGSCTIFKDKGYSGKNTDRHSLAVIVIHHIRKQNDSDGRNKPIFFMTGKIKIWVYVDVQKIPEFNDSRQSLKGLNRAGAELCARRDNLGQRKALSIQSLGGY